MKPSRPRSERRKSIDRRQLFARSEFDNQLAIFGQEAVRWHDQSATRLTRQRRHDGFNVRRAVNPGQYDSNGMVARGRVHGSKGL